jgi:hypothetical protein
MRPTRSKIIEGLKAAVRSARCKHATVVQDKYPNGDPKEEYCIRCETTFHVPQRQ